MLRQISEIWWPRIHRDITSLAKSCNKCQQAGKSIKPLLKQSKFGKLPIPGKTDEEIRIGFAGPFKMARSSKKYLIVSVDSKRCWQDAKILRAPTIKKSIRNSTTIHSRQRSSKTSQNRSKRVQLPQAKNLNDFAIST